MKIGLVAELMFFFQYFYFEYKIVASVRRREESGRKIYMKPVMDFRKEISWIVEYVFDTNFKTVVLTRRGERKGTTFLQETLYILLKSRFSRSLNAFLILF